MVFNSMSFLIFFPIVTLLYFVFPKRIRYVWLLVASYYFYMSWNAKYAILLLISTVTTYIGGLIVGCLKKDDSTAKSALKSKITLGACVFINLGILFGFKYLNFTLLGIGRILSLLHISVSVPAFDILLPVGISFYTFQAIGYLIDVYRGDTPTEKNFLKYALFVSFFPQLVAGPIERSSNLLSQIQIPTSFKIENARSGLLTMAYGLFLKIVIADNIDKIINPLFDDYANANGMQLLLAIILFAFQIYCDFQGYSQLAIGSAKVLGFHIRENFNAPYFASDVRDFWRRWHMSLNTWFIDYLYIPLGGGKNLKGRWQKPVNTMIVFFCSGLWHGAYMHYVLWGIINGIFLVIYNMTEALRKRIYDMLHIDTTSGGFKVLSRMITFAFIDFAWLFFRTGIGEAINIIQKIICEFKFFHLFSDEIWSVFGSYSTLFIMIISLLILGIVDYLWTKGIDWRQIIFRQQTVYRWMIYIALVIVIIMWGAYGNGYEQTQFIYFQF